MEPLYNVGDKVLIKATYDPGYSEDDYRFGFTNLMLEDFGGKVCTILGIRPLHNNNKPNILPDDGYEYLIKEDYKDYSWVSSMFEPEF